jgi:hypothetical protein
MYDDRFTYGDIYHQNEVQFSKHNFELADVDAQLKLFSAYEAECRRMCEAGVPAPALDYCLKASHAFNLLDARGAISVNERQGYILRVRTLAKAVAEAWMKNREALGYPLTARARPVIASRETQELVAAAKAAAAIPPASERAPLLIELGVEEMPARVFGPLLRDLPVLLNKHLEPTQLQAKDIKIFVTPRRVAISVGSILTRQPDLKLELKGPPANLAKDAQGNWTKAALAFAQRPASIRPSWSSAPSAAARISTPRPRRRARARSRSSPSCSPRSSPRSTGTRPCAGVTARLPLSSAPSSGWRPSSGTKSSPCPSRAWSPATRAAGTVSCTTAAWPCPPTGKATWPRCAPPRSTRTRRNARP